MTEVELYGYKLIVPSKEELHGKNPVFFMQEFPELSPLLYLARVITSDKILVTCENIHSYLTEYMQLSRIWTKTPDLYLQKILNEYPNVNEIDVRVWFTYLNKGRYPKIKFIDDFSKLKIKHHVTLKFEYIDNFNGTLDETDKNILLNKCIEENNTILLNKIMRFFDIITYADQNNKIEEFSSMLLNSNKPEYLQIYINKCIPKNVNQIKFCIKNGKYKLLEYLEEPKEKWNDVKDEIIKVIPKLISENILNKKLIETFDGIVEWEKYSEDSDDKRYKVKKDLIKTLSLETNVDTIKILYKYNSKDLNLKYPNKEINNLDDLILLREKIDGIMKALN
jgi:hypothetical protein